MEPRRYLRCLGQPALFAPNGEPIRFRTKKHLALLVYLAVEPGPIHRRERLAEFLWPKARVSEARHSLATALSILRARLGADVLQATRDHVSLPPGRLALDLDRLRSGDVLGDETGSPLQVEAFLDGFEIADAGEFALWKDRQQAKLLPAIKDALVVLIDRCRRTADSHQIEQLADRMLGLDELSEEAIRAKMEARAFAGDRLTALKIFEEWKVKLLEELGAAPSDLVEGMAVRLRRRGWERTTRTDIPTVPTDQWRGRAFIGRGSEYRVLYEAWESLRKGVPIHPLVLGDSGIGKTTLVERLTTAAGLEGAAVSRVQCYDLEREIPYATVGSLIHGLLDRPGVSGTPPEALAELARTVPEVRRRFPTLPPPSDSQGEAARLRLTEAFHEMLQAIADEHPVILVVDDLHHADDASLAMLHLIMRRAKQQRIMVTMIARAGELSRSPQAHRLREGGRGLGIREVEVGPLNVADSQLLLRSFAIGANPTPNASQQRALLKASAGYPMVLELLFRDWQAYGSQSLALALGTITTDFAASGHPSTLYDEVLERIVSTLDLGTQSVLNMAAILGRRLNDVSIYSLVDLSVGQTMTGMAELVRRRVLRDGGGGLEFVNELVRTAAYIGVPSPLRRVLHSKIADRFLELDSQGDSSLSLEIAWHCARAGRLSEATPHLLKGAREAIRSGAPDMAEPALSSALPRLAGGDRSEALLILAEVLQEQGRWLESLDALGTLAKEFNAAAFPEYTILVSLARLRVGLSSATDLAQTFSSLIRIANGAFHIRTRARAGRTAAYVAAECQDRGMFDEVLQALTSLQSLKLDPESLAQLALARALLLFKVRELVTSLEHVRSGIEALEGGGVVNLLAAQLFGGLGTILASQGEYAEAALNHERALALANRLGNESVALGITGNLLLCYCRLGQYETALSCAAASFDELGAEALGLTELQLAYGAGISSAMRGCPHDALEALDRIDRRPIVGSALWMRQAWLLWKADVLYLSKRRGEALNAAREATALSGNEPLSMSFIGPFSRWKVVIAEAEGTCLDCLAILERHLDQISQYDAIDQVDLLAATVHILKLADRDSAELSARLHTRLLALPSAIGIQMRELGVLRTP